MTEYARLVELAAREHELVAEGRLAELLALQEERAAVVAGLPAQPPAEARPHLERAIELTHATQKELADGLEAARRELAFLGQHRRVAQSYAGVAPAITLEATA